MSADLASPLIFTWLIPWCCWRPFSQPLDATILLGLSACRLLCNIWTWKQGHSSGYWLLLHEPFENCFSGCGICGSYGHFLFFWIIYSSTPLSWDILACDSLHLMVTIIANISMMEYDFHFCILYWLSIQELWYLLWKQSSFFL